MDLHDRHYSGGARAAVLFRKQLLWYLQGIGNLVQRRARVTRLATQNGASSESRGANANPSVAADRIEVVWGWMKDKYQSKARVPGQGPPPKRRAL